MCKLVGADSCCCCFGCCCLPYRCCRCCWLACCQAPPIRCAVGAAVHLRQAAWQRGRAQATKLTRDPTSQTAALCPYIAVLYPLGSVCMAYEGCTRLLRHLRKHISCHVHNAFHSCSRSRCSPLNSDTECDAGSPRTSARPCNCALFPGRTNVSKFTRTGTAGARRFCSGGGSKLAFISLGPCQQ